MRRRCFVSGLLATIGYGCKAGGDGAGETDVGSTGGPGSGPGPGSADEASGSGSAGGDLPPEPLGWTEIPDLVFMVGVPAQLDLRGYLAGPTDDVSVTLDGTLPDGLALQDGVIEGTPSAVTPSADYVASADDGTQVLTSNAFSIEVVPASELVEFGFERATPEQIGFYLPLLVALSDEATATVRYREAGEQWREAHPLLRINPDWVTDGAPEPPVDAFAGTIFDLTPGTSYEVEVTIAAPGIEGEVLQSAVTTRPLPPEAGAATVTATPADDLQALFDALAPGTVLELADGTYDVDGLEISVEGTPDEPIVVRGASRDGVVLRTSGRVLYLVETSHLIVENMTLQGSGVDSGTDASSQGVALWNGFVQENITIRNVTITGVDQGIVASGTTFGMLIYECILQGNNVWTAEFIETNLTWNDDGIRIPGEGNCAFQNTLSAFGDTCAVTNGTFSAGIYFYRNRITMTGDDACEGDYSTRNFGFYDNHVQNCATALSLDPVWGGPLYFFRNIVVNTTRGPFKFNNTNSGFMVYNNTIVRTNGLTDWAWVQSNNGALQGWSFRNNLIVFHGGTGNMLALESSGNDPIDFSHNAWHADGSVWWTNSGGSFGSMDEARNALGATTPMFGTATQRHEADVLIDAEPFMDAIPLGADHLVEVTDPFVPTLAGGAAAGGGVAIPNVTDGYSGAAPDIGAVIAGRDLPTWGAS